MKSKKMKSKLIILSILIGTVIKSNASVYNYIFKVSDSNLFVTNNTQEEEIVYGEGLFFIKEMNSSEFLTNQEASSITSVSRGTVNNIEQKWVKIALDGKKMVIPLSPVRYGLVLTNIPSNIRGNGVIVNIKGDSYRARLLEGYTNQNSGIPSCTNSANNTSSMMNSEFNKIMPRLFSSHTPSYQNEENISEYNHLDFLNANRNGRQMIVGGSSNSCTLFRSMTNLTSGHNGSIVENNARGYFPIFEKIN